MADHEVVVVGAGLSGIAFSAFYLHIHPKASLIVLDGDTCVGGAWNHRRMYDGFWSQTSQLMVGFPDQPFEVPRHAPTENGMFEAKYMADYLEQYVDEHIYDGKSLRSRIMLDRTVTSIEKKEGFWITSFRASDGRNGRLCSSKLVVASGRNTIPNMPSFSNTDAYKGRIIHHSGFGQEQEALMTDSGNTSFAIIGGGKSAVDMAYICAKANKIVHWIIRANGEGPALFVPSDPTNPERYNHSSEENTTRWKALFNPSSFMPSNGLLRKFHRSSFGSNYITQQNLAADKVCRSVGRFRDRKDAKPGYEGLEGEGSVFFNTAPLVAVQHRDFFDTIAQRVVVHRDEIARLEDRTAYLASGKSIAVDNILCGTGFEIGYPFFDSNHLRKLGLPYPKTEQSFAEDKEWDLLLKRADQKVIKDYPILQSPSPSHSLGSRASLTTGKLYNCIAPLDDTTVVILGHTALFNAFAGAECQAAWATGYFDGHVKLPPPEKAREEVAYMNAFCQRRYPSLGITGDFIFHELVWYCDRLLADVGLTSHKKKGWRGNWFGPILQSDFKDLRSEYTVKYANS